MALPCFMRLCVPGTRGELFFALACRVHNAHIPRFYAAVVYHRVAGDNARLCLYKCVYRVAAACVAIVRRVAALCSRVGMIDDGGDKNAARLVFCVYGGIVFIYYIIFFFLVT